ncbi:MAG: hypothetical protein AB8B47_10650 [Roseobacter sp.]
MKMKTILISTSFALMASTALSQTTRDQIIEELTEQGFKRIEISRTLFGNTRFEATGSGVEREIVLGKDGTVVRDRSESDDEYDDDEDDDDINDDEVDDDENDDDSESDDSESDGDSDGGGDSEGGDSDGGGDSEGGDSDGGGDSEGGDSDSEGDD